MDIIGPLAKSFSALDRLMKGGDTGGLESLPESLPEAVAVFDKDDHSSNSGVVESGGVHLFELHMYSVGMASGAFLVVILTVLCVILCLRGRLQACCRVTATVCCMQGSVGGG